jgi:hypothetical protein
MHAFPASWCCCASLLLQLPAAKQAHAHGMNSTEPAIPTHMLYIYNQCCCCATHKITSRLIAAMNSSAMTLNRQGLRFSSTWPAGHNSTRTGNLEKKALRAPVAGQA